MIASSFVISLVCICYPLIHDLPPPGKNLALVGDYVELYFKTSGYTTYSFTLLLTLFNVPDLLSLGNITVDIYKIHCDELYTLYDSHSFPWQQTVSSSPNSLPLLPLSKAIPIDSCSDYPSICILDQYTYIVNSFSAVLTYNITLFPFIPGNTKVRIVVFDNLEYFRSFLNGQGIGNAIRTKMIESATYQFVFTSPEMRRPSFLFCS